jgi:hypothetical protein
VLCGLFCCFTQNRWVVDPIAFGWKGFGVLGRLGLDSVGEVGIVCL